MSPPYVYTAMRMPIYEYVCMKCESHFEELVRNGEMPKCPDCSSTKVQKQFSEAVGIEPSRPFADFHSAVPGEFDVLALNGVRPLDRATLDRWRAPKHRERIRQLLTEMPDLPERLISMGYESDRAWVSEYR